MLSREKGAVFVKEHICLSLGVDEVMLCSMGCEVIALHPSWVEGDGGCVAIWERCVFEMESSSFGDEGR